MSSRNKEVIEQAVVRQLAKVQADVTITPNIKPIKAKIYAIPDDGFECDFPSDKSECPQAKTTISVSQVLCLEIPFTFDVDIDIDQGISFCDNNPFDGKTDHIYFGGDKE